MTPTTSPNSMMSLLMSLGGTLSDRFDLSRLELSADGTSGLTDFSDLLAQLTSGDDSQSALAALLSGAEAGADGQILPPGLNLTGKTLPPGLTPDDMSEDDLNQLLAQIMDPPQLTVNMTPVMPADAALLPGTEGTLPDSSDLPLNLQALQGRLPGGQNRSAEGSSLKDMAPASMTLNSADLNPENSLAAQARSDAQQRNTLQQMMQDQQASTDNLQDGLMDDAGRQGLINTDGISNDDPDFLQLQRDRPGLMAGMFQQTDNGLTPAQQVLAGADAAAVRQEAREQADAMAELTDADEMLGDDNFAEKLQNQLADKLRFGEDRREWGPALGARVLTMVADEIQHARIHLDPPELGSLEIKLHVNQDQANVQIHASSHHVRDVLESSAQRLRDALNSQGLELAGFDVQTGTQGQQSGGGQQTGDQQGGQSAPADGMLAADGSGGDSPVAEAKVASLSLLDTFA